MRKKLGLSLLASPSLALAGFVSVADIDILSWANNGAGTSFIKIDPSLATTCGNGWVRIADSEMLAQVLSARSELRPINFMVVRTNADNHLVRESTPDSVTTHCVVQWIEFE